MTNHPMQIVSGRVAAASQKSVVIEVYSQNLGWTTDQNEEVTLRLDSVDIPFMLKTRKTRSIFIAKDDQLDIVYVEHPDRLAIYGIRNVTDGSVYLVRTAKAASARADIVVTIACLVIVGICCGIVGLVAGSTDGLLDLSIVFGGTVIGLFVLSAILRSLFGLIAWPDIRRLAQPGGKHEMNAARKALAIAPKEGRHIRFL